MAAGYVEVAVPWNEAAPEIAALIESSTYFLLAIIVAVELAPGVGAVGVPVKFIGTGPDRENMIIC